MKNSGILDVKPCTALQDFWLAYYRTGGIKSNYNMRFAYQVDGIFNEGFFKEAVSISVLRHEALRTFFAEQNGQWTRQVVKDNNEFYQFIDLSNKSQEKDERLNKLLSETANYIFKLEKDSPIICRAIKLSDENFVITINIFHMVADGSSSLIITNEIFSIYKKLINHEEVDRKTIQPGYSSYDEWEKDGSKVISNEERLRIETSLSSYPAQLNLPFDRERSSDFGRERIKCELDSKTANSIEAFCRSNGMSIHAFFLTTIKIWLYFLTKENDFVVSSLISSRDKPELKNAFGLYLGYLFIHSKIDPTLRFRDFARQTQGSFLDALQTQKSADLMVLSEETWRQKFKFGACQFVYNFWNYNSEPLQVENLLIKEISLPPSADGDTDGDDYDLYLVIVQSPMELYFFFRTDLFSHANADKMLKKYLNLIKVSLSDSQQSIQNILNKSAINVI